MSFGLASGGGRDRSRPLPRPLGRGMISYLAGGGIVMDLVLGGVGGAGGGEGGEDDGGVPGGDCDGGGHGGGCGGLGLGWIFQPGMSME